MAKTTVQRLNDTRTYLQNTLLVPLVERTAAYQLVQVFLVARFPNGVMSPGYDALSNSLSLGYHVFSDPNDRRVKARALFLLWHAIRHVEPAFPFPHANIGQIDLATVDEQLASYIRKACCVLDQHLGGGAHAGAGWALAEFRAHPLAFLRINKVFVRGSTAFNLAGPLNLQACGFYYEPVRDRYRFVVTAGALPASSEPLLVDSVKAFHWTDPRYVPPLVPAGPHNIATTNFGNLNGIQLSGANIMVTTQFTGCAFCMAEHAGSMYCAHVSPAGVDGMLPNTDGTTLARRLMVNGQMQNAGGTVPRVFGRNVGSLPNPGGYNIGNGGGNTTYMTIVGFPGGTSYEIYAQTTRNNAIAGVPVRIY